MSTFGGRRTCNHFCGFFLGHWRIRTSSFWSRPTNYRLFRPTICYSVAGIRYVCSDLSCGSLSGNHRSDIGTNKHIHDIRYLQIRIRTFSSDNKVSDHNTNVFVFVPGVHCAESD